MRSTTRALTIHWLAIVSSSVSVLLGTLAGTAYGSSLDRSGLITGKAPGYYVCYKDLQLVKAGLATAAPNQRLFEITLKAHCGILPEWYLSGGGTQTGPGVDWKPVEIHGSFDYDARWAVEVIDVQEPKANALQANVQCQNNPWVTGQACQLTSLANHTGADASFAYPVSAVLLSQSLRMALQKWEAGLNTPDQLTDWNPGATKASSPFAILTPNLSTMIAANAGSFQLSLSGPTTPPTVVVKLEWTKLTAGKDPSIEPLVYQHGVPANAPQSLSWSQLPRQISIGGVFSPGLYAVRAKVHTSAATEWQFFWIGPPDPDLAKYIPRASFAAARRAEFAKVASGKFELSKLQQVILLGKGQSRLVNVSDLRKLTSVPARSVPQSPTPRPGPVPRGTTPPPASPKGSP